jgi:hypothetical protein
MTSITETSQLITAAFKGLKEYRERAPEGLSKWEVGTLVVEMVKPIKDAAVGIQNVHKELLGMDGEAKAVLLQLIGDHLVEAGVTHRNTDISLSILNWILEGVEVFDFISNLPPTAEPV